MVAPGTNDNVIEDNTVLGNTNGIIVFAGAEGNVIRHNIVAGNPPVQLSVTFPADDGADIKDLATPGANTIDDNFCLTAVNVAACPAVGKRGDKDEKDKDKDGKDKGDYPPQPLTLKNGAPSGSMWAALVA